MCCNGKRDAFTRDDLLAASKAADVKNPDAIICEVSDVIACWPDFAATAGLEPDQIKAIQTFFRAV